jgi:hypothetical protein
MVQAPIFVVTTDPNVQTPAGAKKTNSEHATFVALAVAFEYSDTAFVERFLPWVRFACLWLQRDHSGVVALVRDMVRQGGEVRLDQAETAWASCAEMFSAINEFVESAKVRLSIVRAQIQDEKAERASQMSASEQASATACAPSSSRPPTASPET